MVIKTDGSLLLAVAVVTKDTFVVKLLVLSPPTKWYMIVEEKCDCLRMANGAAAVILSNSLPDTYM